MDSDPVVTEATYNAPPDVVWKAITDADQMRQWFFEPMQEFRPEVGFETQFDVECEGAVYPHQWKVTEVVPQQKIAYDWNYGGFAGQSSVLWELTPANGGTKLTLTHAVHEPFPDDNPIFSRESGEAGWAYFLNESLESFLANAN